MQFHTLDIPRGNPIHTHTWTLLEIFHRKTGRREPHGEFEIAAVPFDLDDINPEEKQLYLDAGQAGELAIEYVAIDGGFVAQLVGTLEREAARAVQEGGELACGWVQIVAGDAFGQDADGEVVFLKNLVGRRLVAACGIGCRR